MIRAFVEMACYSEEGKEDDDEHRRPLDLPVAWPTIHAAGKWDWGKGQYWRGDHWWWVNTHYLYSIVNISNIYLILKRMWWANIQYHGSWEWKVSVGEWGFIGGELHFHSAGTSNFIFSPKDFRNLHFYYFCIFYIFLTNIFWLTWNQLSWNLFLPADFVRLEQRTEEPFLLFDLLRQNLKT